MTAWTRADCAAFINYSGEPTSSSGEVNDNRRVGPLPRHQSLMPHRTVEMIDSSGTTQVQASASKKCATLQEVFKILSVTRELQQLAAEGLSAAKIAES
jgi:hypothetical protein